MKLEYKLVIGSVATPFTEEVQGALGEGWCLSGGVSMCHFPNTFDTVNGVPGSQVLLAQAMFRSRAWVPVLPRSERIAPATGKE